MWRSGICFNLVLCAIALWANALLPAAAATLAGSVNLASSQDPSVRKRLDYSGVVAWLDPLEPATRAVAIGGPRRVRMVQKHKTFSPHILAIAAGTTVDFPNYDPIFHNAFSNYDGQLFDVGLYAPGRTQSVLFHREGIVRVFCNIHPEMSAVIVVLRSDYFAVSGARGQFQIANVPAGSYRLKLFHERATEQTLAALARTVEIPPEGLALPPITVSESGYLPLPHKNKFGHDYAPEARSGRYAGMKP